MGLQEALAKAGPILLEPVSELVVTVPEANQGDVMGDLNAQARPHPGLGVGRRRRGRDRRARADVGDPALRDRPALDDRRPRPLHRSRHSHYDPVPAHLVDKIVASTKEGEKVSH